MLDINLSGVWRTFKAAVPTMIAQGRGGSLIAIASVAGIKSLPAQAHYSAAKHGVVGLTKTAAIELGEYGIRVNSIHPWGVQSPMVDDANVGLVLGAHPDYIKSFGSILSSPQPAEPNDISDAVIYLASNMSRCVTGIQLPVDMGATTV
jgi:NAD(P)-dependent dehydrogenase (short-subunit alcohol dehydrogenase family)